MYKIFGRDVSYKLFGRSLSDYKVAARSVTSTLATGAMTTTEVTNTSTLPNGGFDDGPYSGGYLFESSDGSGQYVGVIAFGGTGTMNTNPRSSILGQSIGEGLDTYSDWVIDGGNKRLVVFQMYYPVAPPYSGLDSGKQAVVDAIAWMNATYDIVNDKVIIAASSQGGNILRYLADDDGDVAGATWCRNNLAGAFHGAAELPATSPDLTGLSIYCVHGADDTTVSHSINSSRASAINTASTGSPVTFVSLTGVGHTAYTWDDPFNVNRSDDEAPDDYDGFLTWLKNYYIST